MHRFVQTIIFSIVSFYCGLFMATYLIDYGAVNFLSMYCPEKHCPKITCPENNCPKVTCPEIKCPDVKPPINKNVPFNGKEKRCIAFTLYPLNGVLSSTHSDGFFHQVILAKTLYPKWRIKLFLSDELRNSIFHKKLISSNDSNYVDIIWKNEAGKGHYGHFWRFLIADDVECDRWIVRDVDCRFTIREMQAVHDWINSGKSFHIMRDAPGHDGEILAGLFGGTRNSLKGKKMSNLIQEFLLESKDKRLVKEEFWSDQKFLAKKVFSIIKDDFIAHDDYSYHGNCKVHGNCIDFPVKDLPFVTHWTGFETVICSCVPRCVCGKDQTCPTKTVAHKYNPICLDNSYCNL